MYEQRDRISGLEMVYEPQYLRFFQARFRPLPAGARARGGAPAPVAAARLAG